MEENIEYKDENQRKELNEEIEATKVYEREEKKEDAEKERKLNEGDKKEDQKEGDEKDNKKEEKKNKEQKEGDKKDEQLYKKEKEKENKKVKESFVYFIETFFNNSSLKIELADSKNSKDLEIVKDGTLEKKDEFNYIIYRVKIIANSVKDTIKIKLKSKVNKEFKAKIELSEPSHDIFYYDFNQFNEKKSKKDKSQEFNASHLQQFKIYLNYIKDSFGEKQRDSEIDSLVLSTSKLFIVSEEKDKKKEIKYYDFYLFLSVFKECYERKIITKLLSGFELDKLDTEKISENFNDSEIEKLRLIFDKLENRPEYVLKYIEDEDTKMKNKIHLYYIIICFRLIFERKKLVNSLSNILKNKDIQNEIYKAVVKNNELFQGTRFSKEQISKMVDVSNTFKRIKRALKYSVDISDLLEIISEKFDHIIEVRSKELEEKGEKPEDFIFKIDKKILDKNDDITKIYELYKNILDKLEEKHIVNFIVFDPELFDKYISYFEKNNFEYLILLRDLVDKIYNMKNAEKKILKKYKDLKIKLREIIHKTGIYLSVNKKLKNIQIINFIIKDKEYIKELTNEEEKEKTIELFQGINMSLIDDEFISQWKSINFEDIFPQKMDDIIKTIIDNTKNFKEFDFLMKILNISKNDTEMKFSLELIQILKDKFIDLYNEQKIREKNYFENNLIELIYHSDLEMSVETPKFLEYFGENMNFDSVIKIYKELFLMHIDKLSEATKNYIISFLIKNSEDVNHEALIEFAEKFKSLRVNIFESLVEKEVQKEDLLNIEENERIHLFKGLLEKANIIDEEYKEIDYVNKSKRIINDFREQVENNEILYSNINLFYENNKQDEFNKRLTLIYFNDKDKVNNKQREIEQKMNVIKDTLETLYLINNDLNEFLPNSEEKNIKRIEEIITGIQTGPLNFYEKKCSMECSEFVANYRDSAINRNEKKNSIFFQAIYNINSVYKLDKERIERTEKQFDKLAEIFRNDLDSVEGEIRAICLNTIKNMTDDEILMEINKLIKIFEKKINDNIFDKNEIIKKMKLLSKRDDIDDALKSIKVLIDKKIIEAKKDIFSDKIDQIIKSLEKSYNEKDINEAKEFLKSANVDIDILYNKEYEKTHKNNYLNILKMFREHSDSINFLKGKTSMVCHALKEFIGEEESGLLTINDIIDFEKCVEFMNPQKSQQNFSDMNDVDLIKLFIDKIENSNEALEARFKTYTGNYSQIKTLFDSKLNISEASRQKISFICKKSEFIVKYVKEVDFEGSYLEKIDNKTATKKIGNIEALFELRDRAQSIKKTTNDEEGKTILKNNKLFIQVVSNISSILNKLRKLGLAGYPNIIEIKINIDNYEESYIWESQTNYQQIIDSLDEKLTELRKLQLNAYEKKPLIRFIYGRQFNMIKNMNKEKLEPLLMYITRNLKTKEIGDLQLSNNNDIQSIIKDCENYLRQILINNSLDLKDIYSTSLIDKDYKCIGLKTYYVTNIEYLERDLFLIYRYMTKNFPISQNILLCAKETSNEELTAFLYRAILCEFNSCFILGGIEYLEDDRKSTICKLLNNLIAKKEMKSCLIILYTNKNTNIYKSLNQLLYRQDLDIPINDCSKKILSKEESKVEIIVSDQSGVGKSHKIKIETEKENKNYKYFPFGGVIDRKEVIKSLKRLNLSEPENCILHLDLYDTDQTELMTEFLFSILITKLYGHDEDLFYFPKEIDIKIEIPNGFVDLISKFPILSLFEKTTLLLRELPDLTVTKELNSNIQIVSNYLKLLKENKIDKVDLFFEGMTPLHFNSYSTKQKAEILSQEECQNLIFEVIKKEIPEPNYYQIKSFIDVLATQFKSFNRNYYISAKLLKDYETNYNIRTFLIENFIKLTKHFTKGAYFELIKTQDETRSVVKTSQYNPEEDVNQAIESLSNIKPNLISFAKFNYSLIFFHEGDGQGFSIISNLPGKNNYTENSDYKGLFYLKNYQIMKLKNQEKVDIPDYKTYSQVKFLEEIKQILDLKNPTTIEKNKETNMIIRNIKKEKIENESILDNNENIINLIKDIEQRNKDQKGNPITKEEKMKIYKMICEENNKVKIKNEEIRKINEERKENEKFSEYEEYINNRLSLEEIVGEYVFTADNFIKMILILLRIRADIPVIMMGETGCGKTSLIKMLSRLLNNGSEKNMKVLNIHAGTSDNDIVNFIEKEILDVAKKIQKENQIEEAKRKINNQIFIPKKIWVFLDEINTCKSMGLISELMCKHSYQGKPLLPNIVFIAACNPYRYGKKISVGLDINQARKEQKKLNQRDLIKLKRTANNNLVYTVNPLPHSLLNYVFDFGNLEANDEIKYIQSIVEKPIKKKGEKLDEKQIKQINNFAIKLISTAQNFTRDKNGIASVSLREIRRFNIFYEFFYDLLVEKKDNNTNQNILNIVEHNFYSKCDYLTLHKYSIILGIFVCYYLRIINNDDRKEFQEIMTEEMIELDKFFKDKKFLDIPNREEKYVLSNIELEKGIAPNRALLDNIFSLFVAINNKIPIFIVGKPGCSKSLSVQLIIKSMNAKKSNMPLFQNKPQIILSPYQGSMASTSRGVEKVFYQAKKKYENLKDENKKDNISMIFFDEMGLAEYSPNNPLKVIHAELDQALEKGKNNIAFVGISNWALDASKMNRGMHLSIPEPTKDDIKEVAFTIGKSYDENLSNQFRVYYEKLGETYYKYKNNLKLIFKNKVKEDFHGNRDFYHLIKYCARNLVDKHKKNELIINKTEKDIAILGLERNFGGLTINYKNDNGPSIQFIRRLYSKNKNDGNYEVLDRIKENIIDLKSRYLLVVSKSSASIFLLSTKLFETNREYNLYVGSPFIKDHHSEEYSLKILNKIQVHMEQGKVLILKNLESVYPALYDLFNQNFTEVGKKNYARLAVGSSVNTFSLVNDEFRCIVIVNEEQIEQEEAPFLNRFEKHIVSLDYFLDQNLKDESQKLYDKLKEMIKIDTNMYKGINYKLENLLFNCDLEEIQGLIYTASLKYNNKDQIIKDVIEKISLIIPQDIILCLKLNKFNEKNQDIFKKIIEGYNKGEHHNLRKFLETTTQTKNIVYTFSNNLETIKNLENIENKNFEGKITTDNIKENIKEIKISTFKSENDFEAEIDEFLEKKYKICIIKFNANEGNFINYVQFFIENKEKEFSDEKDNAKKNKIFVFIVYLSRIFETEKEDQLKRSKTNEKTLNKKILKETVSNLSGFYQIFIDNLNGNDKTNIDNIFLDDLDDNNKIKRNNIFEKYLDFKYEFSNNIYSILENWKLEIPFSYGDLNKETYTTSLIEYIDKNENIKEEFNKAVRKKLSEKGEKDLIKELFKQENIVKYNDRDINGIIYEYLLIEYSNYLSQFYYKAEKDNFFAALLSNEEDKKTNISIDNNIIEIQQKIKEKYLKEFVIEDHSDVLEHKKGKINIYLGLKIPKIISYINEIIEYIVEKIENRYNKNENNLRKGEGYTKYHYDVELKNLNDELSLELSKIKNIFKEKKIDKENDKKNDEENDKENNEDDEENEKENRKENNEENGNENDNENEKEIQLLNIFLEDYYTYFIFENIKNLKESKSNKTSIKSIGLNEVKSFLKYLMEIKEKEITKENLKEGSIEQIARKINWIHCYKTYIITILKMFSNLSLIMDNSAEKIKNELKKYEESGSMDSIVNKTLFCGMESILRILTSDKEIYTFSDNKFYKIKIIKDILQDAFQLSANLDLQTKEAFSLKEIIEIIEAFYKHNIDIDKNIEKIIEYFSEETSLIYNYNERKKLSTNFENFYGLLKNLLENSTSFNKLMSSIFYNEYIKIEDKDFRYNLLKKIISKNEFIYNCYPIMKQIIKEINISIEPRLILENLENIKLNNNNKLIDILNKNESEFLEQVILQILEQKFLKFFDSIENIDKNDRENKECFAKYFKKGENYQKNIIFDKSFEIYEECVKTLNDLISSEKGEDNTSNLCKLYSIAYIKIYLTKFVELIEKYDENEINDILHVISKFKNNTMKVIKIYILKILYNLKNKNWKNISDYNVYREIKKGLYEDNNGSNLDLDYFLLNYFIPTDKIDNKDFIDKLKKFDENSSDSMEIENIDEFLTIAINKIISNLFSQEYLKFLYKEGVEKHNFYNYFPNNYKNNYDNLIKLLDLFLDNNKFLNDLKPKFESQCKNRNMVGEPYESLLYGFRFCAQSLLKSNNELQNYLYSSLFTEKSNYIIKEKYIPGSNIKTNRKLESFKLLKSLIYSSNIGITYFLCKCGYYYPINKYGNFTEEKFEKCPICKIPSMEKEIKKEEVEESETIQNNFYYKIFKNNKTKNLVEKNKQKEINEMKIKDFNINEEITKKSKDYDRIIKNKTLEEYKEEIINPILFTPQKGINPLTREDFLNINNTTRNLSNISYRLLNFILASHLFFSNCLGYINFSDLKGEFLIEDMTCLEIIQSNWNLLERALKEKNIYSIQAFMNLIFNEISNVISNCKIMKNGSDLIKFEIHFENIIQSSIKNYPEFYEKYIKFNKECNTLKEEDIKVITKEIFPPLINIYPEDEYPLLKYFMYTEYKMNFIKAFEQEEDYMEKYPLLYKYINYKNQSKKDKKENGIECLKHLPEFNRYINSLLETYSYRITRDEAKHIKIREVEGMNRDNLKKFLKCWKDIYKYATEYKNEKMEPKELTEEDKLYYFLNDNKEIGYGMYIAAAYQSFITWQNSFLQSIIDSEKLNENLNYYIENMLKKVQVQEANSKQILSIDNIFPNSEYNDFEDLVYTFTKRDIYSKDKINYQRYNKFIFNFEKIEEELGKLILPEKCLFENEDKLNFLIFWGESYSDAIEKFYKKYPQIDLNEEEKKKIDKEFKRIYQNENNYDFKKFFGSMQLFIFFLSNNNFINEKDLNIIIKERPPYLKLYEKFIDFFSKIDFKINKYINIFFYTEHLYFNKMKNNIPNEYKFAIDDQIIKDIKEQLEKKEEVGELSWKDLAGAVRRFISRYLIGYKQIKDKLEFHLVKIDLWKQELRNLDNLNQLIMEKIKRFNLTVEQTFSFYELIENKDEKISGGENPKNSSDSESEDNSDPEDNLSD